MKKYLSFLLLLLFAALFAICGLFFPKLLMDRQQKLLFSKTETMVLPTITDSSGNGTFEKFPTEKLLKIAASYGSTQMNYWQIYPPSSQQLTTEELLKVAHRQIDRLCELEILPEQFSNENYTYEGVEHRIPYQENEETPDSFSQKNSDYSGWIVSGGNNNLTITVYVNSNTGQIFGLEASWHSTDEATRPRSPLQISKQYLKYLELDKEPITFIHDSEYAEGQFEAYNYMLRTSLETLDNLIVMKEEHEKENGQDMWYFLSLFIYY